MFEQYVNQGPGIWNGTDRSRSMRALAFSDPPLAAPSLAGSDFNDSP